MLKVICLINEDFEKKISTIEIKGKTILCFYFNGMGMKLSWTSGMDKKLIEEIKDTIQNLVSL